MGAGASSSHHVSGRGSDPLPVSRGAGLAAGLGDGVESTLGIGTNAFRGLTNMIGFPWPEEDSPMSIVDDLVSNLVERNTIRLSGAFTITLVDGGVSLKGEVISVVRDQRKNKDIVRIKAPVAADVKIGNIIIPLPQIR
jgi:hypothetical protein